MSDSVPPPLTSWSSGAELLPIMRVVSMTTTTLKCLQSHQCGGSVLAFPWRIVVSILSLVGAFPSSSHAGGDFPVPTVLMADPALDWDAKFAGKEGWIGGDGVAS